MLRLFIAAFIAIPCCASLAADVPGPLPAPAPPQGTTKPLRQLQGIDCTFGVACPILWGPKK